MLPRQITKELVVSGLISETTKFNLQATLEAAKSIRHDKESLPANYELLLKLRGIYEFLEKRRKEEDKVEKDIIATRKAGYDEIMVPIAELLEAADPYILALNSEIQQEDREVAEAIRKQISTRDALADFINQTIRQITAAPDNKELVRIQKSIGSQKSHKDQYDEYAGILESVCDELLKLIDGRKKLITENVKLDQQLQKAIADSDQPLAVQVKQLMEAGQRELEENAGTIAENAFQRVAGLPIAGYDFVSKAIKPRTHRWAWKVDDIELLYKKHPEFVVKEPNTKTINAFMKQKAEAEELSEYGENNFNGLVLYRKPFYVSVKSTKDAS